MSAPGVIAKALKRFAPHSTSGVLLYYCLANDSSGLPAVTTIESALSHATQLTQRADDRLFAYFRNYPDNLLVLKACDMRPYTQSDAFYGTRSRGRSVAGGIAYLGNADQTAINGPIMVFSSVIQNVMASIGEAEYAAAFHTAQMAAGLRKTLSDLSYPQPGRHLYPRRKRRRIRDRQQYYRT